CSDLRPLSIECRRSADGDSPAWPPRSISTKAISGFVRAMPYSAAPIRSIQSSPLARPTLGKKQPQRQHDWGVPRAHVSDTRVWQFAILPSAEAHWEATPTECMPFLGIAVSSITGTASLPPTNLSTPCAAKNPQRAGPLPPCPHGGWSTPAPQPHTTCSPAEVQRSARTNSARLRHTMKRDLYAEVSARILAELERGAAPWVKPWSATTPRFLTFKQAIGGRLKRAPR